LRVNSITFSVAARWVRSGETTFASHFLSAALKLREEGLPLVHLAQVTQRSALMLVAYKSHGIHSLQDLDGKKVSVWRDFTGQPEALFRKYHLHVHTVTQGPTINLFMRGGVDAASAMWYNEYHLFLNSGLDEDEVTEPNDATHRRYVDYFEKVWLPSYIAAKQIDDTITSWTLKQK
jgi:NitT/TauT family transport system substrate-binding protein